MQYILTGIKPLRCRKLQLPQYRNTCSSWGMDLYYWYKKKIQFLVEFWSPKCQTDNKRAANRVGTLLFMSPHWEGAKSSHLGLAHEAGVFWPSQCITASWSLSMHSCVRVRWLGILRPALHVCHLNPTLWHKIFYRTGSWLQDASP